MAWTTHGRKRSSHPAKKKTGVTHHGLPGVHARPRSEHVYDTMNLLAAKDPWKRKAEALGIGGKKGAVQPRAR